MRIIRVLYLLVIYSYLAIRKYLVRSKLSITLIKETDMGLVYALTLPVSSTPDVEKRVVKTSVNGVERYITIGSTDTRVILQPVPEGASISIVLQDIDNAGNCSEWSDALEFISKDTLPPSKPGQPTIVLASEVPDAEPAPVVVVAPVEPEPTPVAVVDVTPVNVVTGDVTVHMDSTPTPE
jgi:hypothetical protein